MKDDDDELVRARAIRSLIEHLQTLVQQRLADSDKPEERKRLGRAITLLDRLLRQQQTKEREP